MRRLYLARHGETEWNAIGRLQGATDIPLNDVGRAQARGLGEALAGLGLTAVTTSDLGRARETGTIAGAVLGITALATDPDLRERSFGVFEGKTRAECEASFPEAWVAWQAHGAIPPGGEATEQVVARVKRALDRCFARDETMLVVSHGAAMRLTLSDVLGRPLLPIANGGIYRIDLEGDRYVVSAWGDAPSI